MAASYGHIACLEIIGPSFTDLKLTIVPLSFLELINADEIYRGVRATGLEPRGKGEFAFVIPPLKQSVYVYSPTITSLAHNLIPAKRAFRLYV